MKTGFNLVSKDYTLWVRLLQEKYGLREQLLDSINRSQCSHLWKSLSKVQPLLFENLAWSEGKKSNILYWRDAWILTIGPIISHIPVHANLNLNCSLRGMVMPDGGQNLDLFRIWLFDYGIQKIVSIPPHLSLSPDKIIWKCTSLGSFSVRSVYWSLKENFWNSKDPFQKRNWKYQGPQRVKFFLWLASKQKLLTHTECVRRRIGQNSSCPICGKKKEDTLHIFRDCSVAKEVCRYVVPSYQHSIFFLGLLMIGSVLILITMRDCMQEE